MLIEIWTKEGCTRCTRVIETLRKEFIDAEIIEYDIESLDNLVGEDYAMKRAVRVELAMQNQELPVVFYHGHFVNPDKIVGKSCEGVCRVEGNKK